MYGKSAYSDVTMRKIISEMLRLAKTFIAHERLRAGELEAGEFRFDWLANHNISKMANAELDSRQALLDEQTDHDTRYYHQRRLHDLHKFEMITQQFSGAEHKLLKDFDMYAHIHSLNRDYLINCFISHHYLLALAKIFPFSPDEELLKQNAEDFVLKIRPVIDRLGPKNV